MVKIQADIRGIAYVEAFWKILNFSLKTVPYFINLKLVVEF